MSTDHKDTDERENVSIQDAGSSVDTFVTGSKETGEFQTDEPPGYTPSAGSSNKGINERHANREDAESVD
jgi:hypothetical protein